MAARSREPATAPAPPGVVYAVVKRTVDVVLSAIGLLVASPVIAVVAVAVRLAMGSPVLWRQARSGKEGHPFLLTKFRTMRPPTDAEVGPASDAARITRLGRVLRATSADELPSLWNVLSGDMSLVGPRPLPTQYLPRYSREEARRLDVRPGLTGWAQIHGRNDQSWERRFELDLWYVRHRRLRLDLSILLRTPFQVLARQGIARPGYATMPEFTGHGGGEERPDDA
jgi:lipopolysaccharide/colanic/teichoic acid biosynthesis glycosyltransferase